MSLKLAFLLALLAASACIGLGYLLRSDYCSREEGFDGARHQADGAQGSRRRPRYCFQGRNSRWRDYQESRGYHQRTRRPREENEDRLIKKEEFLDNRQVEIDKEVEYVKNKVAEIKTIRDKADELIQKRTKNWPRWPGFHRRRHAKNFEYCREAVRRRYPYSSAET